MKTKLNDEELIRQQFITNPNACFEELYSRYVRKVYKRCLSMTKDSEKAQDYTHDIFIRTFDQLSRFQEKSTFSTWLYSISFNYCLDQIKTTKRLPMSNLDGLETYQFADLYEQEPFEERLQLLNQTLQKLSPMEASLLRLKYQQGLSIQQIAQQLGLQESAVKMRLKRSRQKAHQLYLVASNR
ncbi:RNA polymerase sigma factor [Spirosoma pollinicola]|uniref:RNA polymerase subunit sigma-24 n=1 Tax=Spirosoma pollinicola TaxID=2057025 RepID=A0A2K8YU38_9BACT|nr:sigma-70 family RNA polymerase sigma factor [Spirosoma pollinicola]AUD01123.1 RNA polymerase subunit sigma-24 [Spirosoma pollinicola]